MVILGVLTVLSALFPAFFYRPLVEALRTLG